MALFAYVSMLWLLLHRSIGLIETAGWLVPKSTDVADGSGLLKSKSSELADGADLLVHKSTELAPKREFSSSETFLDLPLTRALLTVKSAI